MKPIEKLDLLPTQDTPWTLHLDSEAVEALGREEAEYVRNPRPHPFISKHCSTAEAFKERDGLVRDSEGEGYCWVVDVGQSDEEGALEGVLRRLGDCFGRTAF